MCKKLIEEFNDTKPTLGWRRGGATSSLKYFRLLPSLPSLPNGDQTCVSRGLGHFVCILTVILRFAAKRQSIKVLPLKRERSGNELSAEGHF